MTDGPQEDPEMSFNPLQILAETAHAHAEMMDMSRTSRRLELYGFLDGLRVEQLQTLRLILNQDPAGVNYIDGMAASILRLIHKVDPDSGKPIDPEVLLPRADGE